MKPLETFIEQRKERFVKNNLMSDEFLDFVNKNMKPIEKQMSYYQCAIMEVETKFKVLNEQYSLEYDRNPIEDIKSRVKSMESLIKKIRKKDIPLTLSSIEENIHDIAGESHCMSLLSKLENCGVENVVEESLDVDYVKLYGVSVAIDDEPALMWMAMALVEEKLPEEVLKKLMPWSKELPDSCRKTKTR